jgi:crotonobetainyl-CoA:carnitine CoA-transferase CaiB-like acyl-CoA transferase
MGKKAFSDLKVLDCTQGVAGPYCTKWMADFGAEVIKVERPTEGDIARRMGPFLKDEPHPEKSGTFFYLNTNKKSITLNLESETGVKIFKELVRKVDVLVEDFEPGKLSDLGLSHETLKKLNPRLVMNSITDFGQTGPYRHYEADLRYPDWGTMYASTGRPTDRLVVEEAYRQNGDGPLSFIATVLPRQPGPVTGGSRYLPSNVSKKLWGMLRSIRIWG